jgi:hypothetical protein
MKTGLTLYFEDSDRQFVEDLAACLTESDVTVRLWAAGRGSGRESSEDVSAETGYVGVIVSPSLIESDETKAAVAKVLSQEIESDKKVVLAILYKDCAIPLFLRDKRYADCRTGVNRHALEQILNVIGGRYKPVRNPKEQGPFHPMQWAEKEFLKVRREEQRHLFATALVVSISQPVVRDRPDLPIPMYIAKEFGIPLANQHSQGLALSWKGMETYLKFSFKVPGRARGLEKLYRDIFKRGPAKGSGSLYYCILSYGEAEQFGKFSFELTLPGIIRPYVMLDRVPEFAGPPNIIP